MLILRILFFFSSSLFAADSVISFYYNIQAPNKILELIQKDQDLKIQMESTQKRITSLEQERKKQKLPKSQEVFSEAKKRMLKMQEERLGLHKDIIQILWDLSQAQEIQIPEEIQNQVKIWLESLTNDELVKQQTLLGSSLLHWIFHHGWTESFFFQILETSKETQLTEFGSTMRDLYLRYPSHFIKNLEKFQNTKGERLALELLLNPSKDFCEPNTLRILGELFLQAPSPISQNWKLAQKDFMEKNIQCLGKIINHEDNKVLSQNNLQLIELLYSETQGNAQSIGTSTVENLSKEFISNTEFSRDLIKFSQDESDLQKMKFYSDILEKIRQYMELNFEDDDDIRLHKEHQINSLEIELFLKKSLANKELLNKLVRQNTELFIDIYFRILRENPEDLSSAIQENLNEFISIYENFPHVNALQNFSKMILSFYIDLQITDAHLLEILESQLQDEVRKGKLFYHVLSFKGFSELLTDRLLYANEEAPIRKLLDSSFMEKLTLRAHFFLSQPEGLRLDYQDLKSIKTHAQNILSFLDKSPQAPTQSDYQAPFTLFWKSLSKESEIPAPAQWEDSLEALLLSASRDQIKILVYGADSAESEIQELSLQSLQFFKFHKIPIHDDEANMLFPILKKIITDSANENLKSEAVFLLGLFSTTHAEESLKIIVDLIFNSKGEAGIRTAAILSLYNYPMSKDGNGLSKLVKKLRELSKSPIDRSLKEAAQILFSNLSSRKVIDWTKSQ